LAVFEKINYDTSILEEALEELNLFYKIDNTRDVQSLVDYANGLRDNFELDAGEISTEEQHKIRNWFDEHDMLTEWRSMYLIILEIVSLEISETAALQKVTDFATWSHSEFRYSFVGTIYACILFSRNRFRKMMKYRKDETSENKRKAINNMTWDLFGINYYFRQWTGLSENTELLLATSDKVFSKVLNIAIEVNKTSDLASLAKFLDPREMVFVEVIDNISSSELPREFEGEFFRVPNQRQLLIDKLERILI